MATSWLPSLFEQSRSEIWNELERQVGGEVIDRGFWSGGQALVTRVRDWTVTLDEYSRTMSAGPTPIVVTHTRMRAPFANPSKFRFSIRESQFFDGVGKFFGMQDVEVGDAQFDESFLIQSNDPEKVRTLFGDPELRSLVLGQPRIGLSIVDDEGWFGERLHADADVLVFDVAESIRDVARLKSIFDIFAETLVALSHINARTRAYR